MTSTKFKSFFSASKVIATAGLAILLCGWFSSIGMFADTHEELRRDVLRLHILANSDSPEDQRIKLCVRDRILKLDSSLFSSGYSEDKSDAENDLITSLPIIREEAEAELRLQGSDASVTVELVNMYFTTRVYEDFTLPAGNYDALRITIGEAKGKNWWCVLYPPLCLPAASESEKKDAMALLTPEEAALIQKESKYQYGFAVVELFETIKGWLEHTD